MIRELMQFDYLSKCTQQVASVLQKPDAILQTGDAAVQKLIKDKKIERDDLVRALAAMEQAAAALQKPVTEDATFFPRDPAVSQVQSLLQRYFIDRGLIKKKETAGLTDVADPISDVSLASSVSFEEPKRLFEKMGQTDVGWIACWAAQAVRAVTGRRAFPQRPADPKVIANNARLFLVGDWGSGVSRANKIGDRMRTMLEAETAREQHVVHLGDVYYSGWPEEYDDHFLPHWPVAPGKEDRYGSWNLNANHDMYSGGFGYFDYLLKDSRFKAQQRSSYFSLQTKHWLILGLDSAWKDEALAGDQVAWVRKMQTDHPDKKLVLMTHHQPFSAFEKDCDDLKVLLAQNKVTAWFWGHEHRFALYKPRPDLKYGRLIGHSGVPVWASSMSTPATVQYMSTRSFPSGLERFSLFGFAVLDFADERISIRYFDEHGQVEQTETMQ